MDLNIIKIHIPFDGKPLQPGSAASIRYAGHYDLVNDPENAKLFTTDKAKEGALTLQGHMGLTAALIEIIPLAEIVAENKSHLRRRWAACNEGDINELHGFLSNRLGEDLFKPHSTKDLSAPYQFHLMEQPGYNLTAGTSKLILQLTVSLPGLITDADIKATDYGFSRFDSNYVGYGAALFTVFTFTE